MPTHEEDDRFWSDWKRLTPAQRSAFLAANRKFVHDLRSGRFRKGLRVKPVLRSSGVWEMTWADDGRALFRYGTPIRPGDPHIVWLRVGTHDILDEP